jgi:sialate O-acetylesterase
MVIKGKNTVTRTNILVGEVWLASGQSNMLQMVNETFDSALDIAGSARFPMIRELKPGKTTSYTPLSTGTGAWKVAGPDTTGDFTAVGYYFARTLYESLHVPVGIINRTRGASNIPPWMDAASLKSDPDFAIILDHWAKNVAKYPEIKAKLDADIAKWEAEKAAAQVAKKPFNTPVPAKVGPVSGAAPTINSCPRDFTTA